ncbi:hypothetical protein, partial [Pseudomonas aeruginosa]|uniref:hypothetical protein n=1 Tax=Pseudomonas aeruginosa TaxID=287 RepID=UPI0029C054B0
RSGVGLAREILCKGLEMVSTKNRWTPCREQEGSGRCVGQTLTGLLPIKDDYVNPSKGKALCHHAIMASEIDVTRHGIDDLAQRRTPRMTRNVLD